MYIVVSTSLLNLGQTPMGPSTARISRLDEHGNLVISVNLAARKHALADADVAAQK
jgi:hypothetical protein